MNSEVLKYATIKKLVINNIKTSSKVSKILQPPDVFSSTTSTSTEVESIGSPKMKKRRKTKKKKISKHKPSSNKKKLKQENHMKREMSCGKNYDNDDDDNNNGESTPPMTRKKQEKKVDDEDWNVDQADEKKKKQKNKKKKKDKKESLVLDYEEIHHESSNEDEKNPEQKEKQKKKKKKKKDKKEEVKSPIHEVHLATPQKKSKIKCRPDYSSSTPAEATKKHKSSRQLMFNNDFFFFEDEKENVESKNDDDSDNLTDSGFNSTNMTSSIVMDRDENGSVQVFKELKGDEVLRILRNPPSIIVKRCLVPRSSPPVITSPMSSNASSPASPVSPVITPPANRTRTKTNPGRKQNIGRNSTNRAKEFKKLLDKKWDENELPYITQKQANSLAKVNFDDIHVEYVQLFEELNIITSAKSIKTLTSAAKDEAGKLGACTIYCCKTTNSDGFTLTYYVNESRRKVYLSKIIAICIVDERVGDYGEKALNSLGRGIQFINNAETDEGDTPKKGKIPRKAQIYYLFHQNPDRKETIRKILRLPDLNNRTRLIVNHFCGLALLIEVSCCWHHGSNYLGLHSHTSERAVKNRSIYDLFDLSDLSEPARKGRSLLRSQLQTDDMEEIYRIIDQELQPLYDFAESNWICYEKFRFFGLLQAKCIGGNEWLEELRGPDNDDDDNENNRPRKFFQTNFLVFQAKDKLWAGVYECNKGCRNSAGEIIKFETQKKFLEHLQQFHYDPVPNLDKLVEDVKAELDRQQDV